MTLAPKVDGAALGDEHGLRALAALSVLRSEPIGARVRDVRTTDTELTLLLRSGLEVRLGDASNVRLKLAIARRILPRLSAPGYLDVSVPARVVSQANPKVGD